MPYTFQAMTQLGGLGTAPLLFFDETKVKAAVQKVQTAARAAGFYTGDISGTYDTVLHEALSRWAKSVGFALWRKQTYNLPVSTRIGGIAVARAVPLNAPAGTTPTRTVVTYALQPFLYERGIRDADAAVWGANKAGWGEKPPSWWTYIESQADCPPNTLFESGGCRNLIESPRNAADCPAGYTFRPAVMSGSTCVGPCPPQTVLSPARCISSAPCSCPAGFNLKTQVWSLPKPMGGVKPTGNCPPPNKNSVQYCVPSDVSLPPEPLVDIPPPEPPRPAIPQSQADCPPGSTFKAGTYHDAPPGVSPSLSIPNSCTPPASQTDCPTGYVFQLVEGQNKCVVVPQPPAKVKTEEAGKGWFVENWKWLAALAAVGGVAYYYSKRKTALGDLGDYCAEFFVHDPYAPEKSGWRSAGCHLNRTGADAAVRNLRASGNAARVVEV